VTTFTPGGGESPHQVHRQQQVGVIAGPHLGLVGRFVPTRTDIQTEALKTPQQRCRILQIVELIRHLLVRARSGYEYLRRNWHAPNIALQDVCGGGPWRPRLSRRSLMTVPAVFPPSATYHQ
jgi:hypothetical protein